MGAGSDTTGGMQHAIVMIASPTITPGPLGIVETSPIAQMDVHDIVCVHGTARIGGGVHPRQAAEHAPEQS